MKIKQIATSLAVLTVFILPTLVFANTYQYVDSNGNLQEVQANSSTEALATAINRAVHSGVMLVGTGGVITNSNYNFSVSNTTNTSGSFYQFVDTSGNIQSINAASAEIALATAVNRHVNSGVILVNNNTSL
ncbi:MAG: hypothetical protein WDZ73_01640 [Candidatus Paceibacterota bacterium]